MIEAVVAHFDQWRSEARRLLRANIAPSDVLWLSPNEAQTHLFTPEPSECYSCPTSTPSRVRVTEGTWDQPPATTSPAVPKRFLQLARLVSCHSDRAKWGLLYEALWRITHGERNLLKVVIDPTISRLDHMRREVGKDIHRMHAFVRFRRVEQDGREAFIAWYRPDHDIVELAAPFFVDRFRAMTWSILTPNRSAHWDGARVSFTRGTDRTSAPTSDELENLWRTYYSSTFNPARTNLRLMRAEMPARHWDTLPELDVLPQAIADAPERLDRMLSTSRNATSAQEFIPLDRSLPVLREAVRSCRGCSLHECATQSIFGEGPSDTRIVLIGEQPGDTEDQLGRPFVGPAGEVLDRALADAGIARDSVYVTNAVKHFAFTQRGKQRLHRTPRLSEVVACKPWLLAELDAIRPAIIVCLGATAAKSLFGAQFRLTESRGRVLKSAHCDTVVATYHPSAALRAGDTRQADDIFRALVHDLRLAKSRLAEAARDAIKA